MVTVSVTCIFSAVAPYTFQGDEQKLRTVIFTSIKECYLCKASQNEPGPLHLPAPVVPGSEQQGVSSSMFRSEIIWPKPIRKWHERLHEVLATWLCMRHGFIPALSTRDVRARNVQTPEHHVRAMRLFCLKLIRHAAALSRRMTAG